MENSTPNTILFFIRFRILQIYRAFAEAGIGYVLILLFVASLLGMSWVAKLHQSQHWIQSIALVFPALSRHFLRKDTAFLRHLTVYKPILYIVDYLILALPLFITMAFYQPLSNLLLGVLGIVIIAFFPILKSTSQLRYFNFSWIPLSLFEWRSGFRKWGILFILLYILSFMLVQFVGMFILFVLLATFLQTSLFNDCEPKELLPVPFSLSEKVAIHVGVWSLLLFPLFGIYLYFHLELWYLLLAAWLFGASSITFCLAYKYALWSPFRKDVGVERAAAIFIGMMLIIFTAPACVFAIGYYWRKTNKNYQLFC
jgi:hypothetical protein